MIFYIDTLVKGPIHILYNTSFLRSLADLVGKEKVIFYADITHAKTLYYNYPPLKDISFKATQTLQIQNNKSKIINWFNKIKYDIVFFYKLKHQLKNPQDIIFISGMATITMPIFALFHRFFYKKNKVIFTLHGEVETLVKTKGSKQKIDSWLFKLLMKFSTSNFIFFVMSEFVEHQLRTNTSYFNRQNLKSIEHPIINNHNNTNAELKYNTPLVFGHIGSLQYRKNSQIYFSILDKLKNKNINAIFKVVGKNVDNFDITNQMIVMSNQDEIMDRNFYENELKTLHFGFFIPSQDTYQYRHSGAISEAIIFKIPMIYMNHQNFKFLEQKHGQLGFCFNSEEEVVEFIEDISKDPEKYKDQYIQVKNNLNKLNEKLDFTNTYRKWDKIFQELDIKP